MKYSLHFAFGELLAGAVQGQLVVPLLLDLCQRNGMRNGWRKLDVRSKHVETLPAIAAS